MCIMHVVHVLMGWGCVAWCSGMVWVLDHVVVQLDPMLPMVDVDVHEVGVACQLTGSHPCVSSCWSSPAADVDMLLAACVASLLIVAFYIVIFPLQDPEPNRMVYCNTCGACAHGLGGCSGMVWVQDHDVWPCVRSGPCCGAH
jgi:hypothetical protein